MLFLVAVPLLLVEVSSAPLGPVGILGRATTMLRERLEILCKGLQSQLEVPDSPLSLLSHELGTVFMDSSHHPKDSDVSDEYGDPRQGAPNANAPEWTPEGTVLEDVNRANPTDLSALAKRLEQHEIIFVDRAEPPPSLGASDERAFSERLRKFMFSGSLGEETRQLRGHGENRNSLAPLSSTKRRRLGGETYESDSEDCLLRDYAIVGSEFAVVRSSSYESCSMLCARADRCSAFTWVEDTLCHLYKEVQSLRGQRKSISAARSCQANAKSRLEDAHIKDDSEAARSYRGQNEATPKVDGVAEELPLPPREPALSGQQIGGVLPGGALSALNAASTVMQTGGQLMQALPVREMAQAGMALAQSGFLRNRSVNRGAALSRDKDALPPPPGSGSPTVLCHPEGMTCCVPRQAVADWRKKPPYLNDYNTVECRSTYSTQQDAMCATAAFFDKTDEGRCGMKLAETDTMTVYTTTLSMTKGMNNARCECISLPSGVMKAAARWEYSLAAQEELQGRAAETENGAQKFARGANAAMAVTKVLSQAGRLSATPESAGPMGKAGGALAMLGGLVEAGSQMKNLFPRKAL